jgi:hypothetical protein
MLRYPQSGFDFLVWMFDLVWRKGDPRQKLQNVALNHPCKRPLQFYARTTRAQDLTYSSRNLNTANDSIADCS